MVLTVVSYTTLQCAHLPTCSCKTCFNSSVSSPSKYLEISWKHSLHVKLRLSLEGFAQFLTELEAGPEKTSLDGAWRQIERLGGLFG
jgi:hypothetical protein